MEQLLFDYWLYGLHGIGSVKRRRLLEYFGDARCVYEAGGKLLAQVAGLQQRDIHQILDSAWRAEFPGKWKDMQKKGIRFVSINSPEYPERLKHIFEPPYGIFYRGRLPDGKKKSVAVVGARNASYAGNSIARRLGRELAEHGVQVISGMARGIDINSQRGVLSLAGGQTYAVLGSGIDICYPREHRNEYAVIPEMGGILSEYAAGTPPCAGNFPRRNRIISGLADGVLVVEARASSGSLITAGFALEQGKDIFAVPGAVGDPLKEGCNQLIKQGAAMVTCVQDILDAMGLFYDETITAKKKKNQVMLETAEKIVYANLGLEPVHVSRIAERVHMEIPVVMEILVSFEIRKLAQMVGNNYYALRLS